MTPFRFVFVLEQGLGHTVHSLNIESALAAEPDIDATLLKVRPGETPGVRPLPLVRNWSVQTSWAARRALRQDLGRRPADCVFIHTQVAALFLRAAMRRVPTVISLDATPLNFDSQAEAYGHRQQARPVEWAKLRVNRRALAGAAATVTWSQWAADSLVNDYGMAPDRVHPIYPGVQLSRFRPRAAGHDGPLRLLFVGGDFIRKGGLDLLEAVRSLGGAIEVDIVTSSPGQVPTHPGAGVSVYSGVDPNSAAMADLYGRADVFVLPTRGDCTPLVIAEAMASGLAIVSTTVGSIPDMVSDGRNGILVPPADPRALAAALASLARDRRRLQEMGALSRRLAEAEHDSVANCRRIFQLMRQAAAGAEQVVSR